MKLFLPLLIILLSACGSTKEKKADSDPSGTAKPVSEVYKPVVLPEPGPDQSRIRGTIKSILPVSGEKGKGLCATHVCMAAVWVSKVISKGNSFRPAISEESEITIHFEYTLEPTDGLVSDLEQNLPGLKAGDSFETILTAPAKKMGMESTPVIYKAYIYNRL